METKTQPIPDLNDVQSIILKPHGRHFVKCIFLEFLEKPAAIRSWIADFAKKKITSTSRQNELSEIYRSHKIADSGMVFGLYLSKFAFQKMEIPPDEWPPDNNFLSGMKPISGSALNDPPIDQWKPEFARDLDAMVLIAGNYEPELNQKVNEMLDSLRAIVPYYQYFIENGKRLFHRFGEKILPIEPFGFRDGLSQPKFFDDRNKNELLPENWKLVLDEKGGSYFVFRKLKQDVEQFHRKISELAKRLNITREFAEAQVVGRFKDGTPLSLFASPRDVLSRTDLERIEQFNNLGLSPLHTPQITYEEDPQGQKCPFHAHIRQMNPRNEMLLPEGYGEEGQPKDLLTIIARRGIPYDDPGGEVGLLFMAFQKNIRFQFRRMQNDWANEVKYQPLSEENQSQKNLKPGLDPVIGQGRDRKSGGPDYPPQQWNKDWGKPGKEYFDFRDVVTMRGGEYFYAAPISFLANLDG